MYLKRGVAAKYNDAGLTRIVATTSRDTRVRHSPRLATKTLRATAGQKSRTGQRESTSVTDHLTLSAPCRVQ